ncbi:MAG: complex I subunit 5 family protein [Treponema sp.]|jgi:hydrogenase-4 component B|nr:complex I subunit 5 family protein [Treponema sp.]
MTGEVLLFIIIFFPLAIGFAVYFIGKVSERAQDVAVFATVIAVSISSLLLLLYNRGLELYLADLGAFSLFFRADGFRALYACVASFLWLVTTIFSPEYFSHSKNKNRYWLFNLLTLGSVMGVLFSPDFFTAFFFFEIMAFSAYALVAHDESPTALRAAETYLAVAIISGFIQLMGMLILQMRIGTLEFTQLYEVLSQMPDKSSLYLPGALLLLGFGAKAGMFPLHIWLPKAHPVAPAPASALLSGILTKTGVFGVVFVSYYIFLYDHIWGVMLLIPAAITMFSGALLALFSNDLKRTLACSSVSQIGFILSGVAMLSLLGEENTLALNGTLLHMLNHSLFKLILFLAAGIVYINRHELSLNKIRGFGRGKPLFFFTFLMAALGITGVPLWSGFISKTLLHKSLSDGIYYFQGLPLELPLRLSYYSLVITGALTFAYMTKLFVTLFVEKGDDNIACKDKKRYVSLPSGIALAATAALVPLLGTFTGIMDAFADVGEDFFHSAVPDYILPYFTWYNIRSSFTSIAIGAGIYFIIVRGLLMRNRMHLDLWPGWLDLENLLYRPLLKLVSLSDILRPSPETLRTPGTFLSRHVAAFSRRINALQNSPAIVGHFSLDLLFLGAGVIIVIAFVVIRALV